MTSIPFLFPAPGGNAQSSGLAGAAGPGGAQTAFAGLVSLDGVGSGELLDTTTLPPFLQSPAANALPPDVLAQLAVLFGENAPQLSPESAQQLIDAAGGGNSDEDPALPDLLAGLLQSPPQPIILPEGGGVDAAPSATQAIPGAPTPAGPAAPAAPPVASPAGILPDPLLGAPGQAAGDGEILQPPALLPAGAEPGTAGSVAAAAAAMAKVQLETASVPADAAKFAAAASQPQSPSALQQQQQADPAASIAGKDGQPTEERKTAEKPKAVAGQPDKTGLERALDRTAEQAQSRIEANLDRRALMSAQEKPELLGSDTSTDTPDLGTPQGALDAARSVRLAALTGSNGQAHLPIAQLAVQIAAQARAGTNRFSIRLDPPELGKIDIRLEIAQDGSVASRLSVERPETLDMLLRDAKALERALNDAGLKTDDGSLRFSLKGEGFGRNQQGDAHGQNARSDAQQLATIDALNDGAALAEVRRYIASSGLDIVV